MNAAPCAPLVAGSKPNSRISAPIGALAAAVASGTTSMTGARFRLTPAARRSVPHCAAAARSVPGGQPPWTSADGIAAKPGPVSCCIWPPSWLAAMNKPMPPVSDDEKDCIAVVCLASAPVPAALLVSSSDPK
jgi:hypothetical protein